MTCVALASEKWMTERMQEAEGRADVRLCMQVIRRRRWRVDLLMMDDGSATGCAPTTCGPLVDHLWKEQVRTRTLVRLRFDRHPSVRGPENEASRWRRVASILRRTPHQRVSERRSDSLRVESEEGEGEGE